VKESSSLRWWRVVVRWGDRVIADQCVRGDETLRIGEATALAVPGLELADHALVRGGRIFGGAGLVQEIEAVDRARLRVAAHPEITIDVEAQAGERVRFRDPFFAGLAREAGYGLMVLGCVVAWLAIPHAQSTAEVRGDEGIGRIERAMHETPIATFATPPEMIAAAQSIPVAFEVALVEDSPVAATPVGTPSPTAALPTTKTDPRPKKRLRKKVTRPDSHVASGDVRAPGSGKGLAAVAPAQVCDDPRIEPKPQVDVVFVLDVSTTMGFVLDKLSREIEAVDAEVRKHDATPHYGLVVFVDDVKVVDGGKAFTDIRALAKEFDRWAKFTADNRQIGAGGSNLDWPENSLDALHAAATQFEWRDADDTVRVIVHATDDSFGSAGDVLSGTVTVAHDYAQTVAALRSAQVRVATFTAAIGGKCECDDVGAGFTKRHADEPSLPDATGGAAFDIDDVARGQLHFADALPSLVTNAVCDE
jgi:hypothetical protein